MSENTSDANAVIRQALPSLNDIAAGEAFDWDSFAPRPIIEAIDDTSLLPEIAAALATVPNDFVHHFLVYLLGRLWQNTGDQAVCRYLIDQVLENPKDPTAAHFLSNLRKLPATEAKRLGALLDPSHRRLWSEVLQALQDSEAECCEDEVLAVLQGTHSQYDRMHACRVLGHIKSEKALPVLRELLFDKDTDTAYAATGAVTNILESKGSDLYLQLLGDPKFRHKDLAAWQVTRYCDGSAVPAIVERLKQMTGRKRSDRYLWSGSNHLTDCIEFLEKHSHDNPEVAKLYQTVRKRWDRLLPEEREYIVARIPAFSDMSWNVPASATNALPAGPDNVAQATALQLFRRCHCNVRFDENDPARPVISLTALEAGRADEYAAALQYFPTLVDLSLAADGFRNEHLAPIARMSSLKTLLLAGPGITDAGLAHLACIHSLVGLTLRGCHIGDAAVEWIHSQPDLRALAIRGSNLTAAGCQRLLGANSAASRPQVAPTSVTGQPHLGARLFQLGLKLQSQLGKTIGVAGMEQARSSQDVPDISGLVSLDISDVAIGDEGFAGIDALAGLQELRLSRTKVTDRTVASLMPLRHLTLLDLRDTGVTDKSIEHLLKMSALKVVYLAGTAITSQGFERLHEKVPGANQTAKCDR